MAGRAGVGHERAGAESRALVSEGGAHLVVESWVTSDSPFMSCTYIEPHTLAAMEKAIERACSLQLV